jgi:hypothetical protein
MPDVCRDALEQPRKRSARALQDTGAKVLFKLEQPRERSARALRRARVLGAHRTALGEILPLASVLDSMEMWARHT